ncbi:MAG: hypothetical protein ACM3PZ_03195 [Bacillota bacterium]
MSTSLLLVLIATLVVGIYWQGHRRYWKRYCQLTRYRDRLRRYRLRGGSPSPKDGPLVRAYLSYLFRLSSWKGKRDLLLLIALPVSWLALASGLGYAREVVILSMALALALAVAAYLFSVYDLSLLGGRDRELKDLDKKKGLFLIFLALSLLGLSAEYHIYSLLSVSAFLHLYGVALYVFALYHPSFQIIAYGFERRKKHLHLSPE